MDIYWKNTKNGNGEMRFMVHLPKMPENILSIIFATLRCKGVGVCVIIHLARVCPDIGERHDI